MELAPKRTETGPPSQKIKNQYNKEYVRLKDITIKDIKLDVDSFTLNVAIVMLAALEIGTDSIDNLYRYLGYNVPKYNIKMFSRNLHKNGVWKNDVTVADWEEEEGGMEFLLDIMVAKGLLEKRYKPIKEYKERQA